MENPNYRRKHLRENLLHQEMNQVFVDWVRGLRSIEQAPEDSLTPLCGVEQRGNHKTEFSAQESDPPPQSDDEGRWQDDGGESG